MKKTLLMECLLCALLLFSCLFLSWCKETKVAQAGAFSGACFSNDTFEDLSNNLLGEMFL